MGWVTLGLPAMLNHTKEHRGTDEMRGKGESDREVVTGRWGQGRVLRTVRSDETAILSRM